MLKLRINKTKKARITERAKFKTFLINSSFLTDPNAVAIRIFSSCKSEVLCMSINFCRVASSASLNTEAYT